MNFTVPIPIITVASKKAHGAFIGLNITFTRDGDIDAALLKLEGYARRAAAEAGKDLDTDDLFMIGIVMPCGCRYLFRRAEDIPRADVACDCGNPTHKVIHYHEQAAPVPVEMWP